MTFLVDGTLGGTFPSWTTATRPASPAVGQMGYNTTTGLFDQYVGGAWQSVSVGTGAAPQVTVYTSGSGTYSTPTSAKYLFVRVIGGGSGGQGGNTGTASGANGGAGGNSTFGASLTAIGGNGYIGGGASGGDVNITGGSGGYAVVYGNSTGAFGGNGPFGGGGGSVAYGNNGVNGATNTGGGAGGGCGAPTAGGGVSGGAGGYVEKTISSPAATYAYAVGAGGTSGAAGGAGAGAGGTGGSGIIIVAAFF